jgi:hypothetical protein
VILYQCEIGGAQDREGFGVLRRHGRTLYRHGFSAGL